MGTELDSVRAVLRELSDAYVHVLQLRQQFPQHTEQLLNVPRHMSLAATDIEGAILRLHYAEGILTDIPSAV